MPAYRLSSPYDGQPLRRRASGFGLALAINLGLLLILLTLGVVPPPAAQHALRGIVVDLVPESRSASPARRAELHRPQQPVEKKVPAPKPPPIVLPVKPTIAPPPDRTTRASPWLEMNSQEMAASDISKLPAVGSGSGGDSEIVGRGPNGEALYNAEWAREPTDSELSGYLPRNAPDGYGLVECRTAANDRVEDCIELENYPAGSHLASAVRQAAWQFRVRPPRKGGRPLIGSWVRIRIDYSFVRSARGEGE